MFLVKRKFSSLLINGCENGCQHENHLGTCLILLFSGLILDLMNQKLWEWNPAVYILTNSSGVSSVLSSLRVTDTDFLSFILCICHRMAEWYQKGDKLVRSFGLFRLFHVALKQDNKPRLLVFFLITMQEILNID